ncbi:MAG: RNA polymerase sigma factor RpoD/SigA [Patescibacteria group bacterium]
MVHLQGGGSMPKNLFVVSAKLKKTVLIGDSSKDNFDPHLTAYFKKIMALGRGRSPEWEIGVAKQIDEGRKIIIHALRELSALLVLIAKKDPCAQVILAMLKSNVLRWKTIGSERFIFVENAFSEIETIVHTHNNALERASFIEARKQFGVGREIFERSRNELVEKNLCFAVSIAKKYFYHRIGLSPSDVINEANIGLIKAAERYRYAMGFRFTTYAHWWIRQAILRAYDNKSRGIRVPVHRRELWSKISRVQKNLSQRFTRESKPEEVAKQLGVSPDDVLESGTIFTVPHSIDARIPYTEDVCLKDVIPDNKEKTPEALYAATEHVAFIKKIMEQVLDPREQYIIQRRFGFNDESPDQTFRKIGRVLNLSYERVRQIQNEAIEKLRSPEILKELRLAV